MKKLIFGLLFIPMAAWSAEWSCWYEAGKRYNVSPSLLYAIALVETGNKAHAINKNRNGTYDIGLMQINSSHLKWLSTHGITAQKLLQDPCLNVHVAAYILRENINRYGWNWKAIGAYNAASESKQAAYALKVINTHRKIMERGRSDRVRLTSQDNSNSIMPRNARTARQTQSFTTGKDSA